jgi:uncharacterized RDD family membrane protein YckC
LQTIEINTAQNVKIEYELASLGQRIFAYLIDLSIMVIVFLILILQIGLTYTSSNLELIVRVVIFIWFGFYNLFSEIIGNGQSIGKRAMGIKVIKLNGDEAEFYDYFSRWSLRLIDIYFSIGSLAMLLIASNKNGQRIGDIIAGTTVIRKRSAYGFQLNDILKLNLKNKEEHTFLYPLAKNLEEKDVILIKNLLYRYRLYNNKAHENAINKMTEKLAMVLELESIPKDKQGFLNQVISEYIILTR